MSGRGRWGMAAVLGLAAPPTDADVLIPGEWVVYREPQHMMVLLPSALRAAAAAWLALLVVLGLPFGTMTAVEWVVVVLAVLALWDWVRRREPWDVGLRVALLVVLSLLLGLGARGTAVVLAVAVVSGFVVEVVQWRWYRFLYVTNRRMIQTGGVFDRTYNMMPVTRITDLQLKVSWLGEALGYGRIVVESAGQNQALSRLEFLTNPDAFVRDVLRLATRPATMDDD